MANRHFNQFSFTHEKMPVTLYAVAVGNAGADMVLKQWDPNTNAYINAPAAGFKGIKSIAYNAATGKFKINLQDSYQRLLGLSVVAEAVDGATLPTVTSCYVESTSVRSTTAPYVAVVLTAVGAGPATVPANPTTNARLYFTITLSNSSAV